MRLLERRKRQLEDRLSAGVRGSRLATAAARPVRAIPRRALERHHSVSSSTGSTASSLPNGSGAIRRLSADARATASFLGTSSRSVMTRTSTALTTRQRQARQAYISSRRKGTTNDQQDDQGRHRRVGNCASSLLQGIEYYRNADPSETVPGLMHVVLGGYHVGDTQIVAAFDVDAEKVGLDLSKAIWASRTTRSGSPTCRPSV